MAAQRPIVRPPTGGAGLAPNRPRTGRNRPTGGAGLPSPPHPPGGGRSTPHPPTGGAGLPGASNPGTHTVTTTQTITPPPVAPFLTAAQQTGINQAGDSYTAGMLGQNTRVHNAMVQAGLGNPANFDLGNGNIDPSQVNQALNPSSGGDYAAAQTTHDRNVAQANDELAARGMFQSSVRANDLADIDTALALRQNEIRTNLANLIGDAAAQVQWLTHNWSDIQGGGIRQAAENAMNSPAAQPYQQTTTAQVPNAPPAGSPGSTARAPAGQTPTPGRVPAMTGVTNRGGTDIASRNTGRLAPGVTSPNYALVRPSGHPNAVWAGTKSPGAQYKGIGGGWYEAKPRGK